MSTSVHTPESNSLAKRMNRTLLYKVRAILKVAGMSNAFWSEVMYRSAYLNNRTIILSQNKEDRNKRFTRSPPTNHNLKVCGCVSHAHFHKVNRTPKSYDRSTSGIFLGIENAIYRIFCCKLREWSLMNMQRSMRLHFRTLTIPRILWMYCILRLRWMLRSP